MLVSTRRRHQVYFSLLVIYYVVYYDSRITHKTGRRMRPAVRMGVIEKLAHPFCLSCVIVCSFAVVDRCCQGPLWQCFWAFFSCLGYSKTEYSSGGRTGAPSRGFSEWVQNMNRLSKYVVQPGCDPWHQYKSANRWCPMY
jgi:hypothetical protein